MSVVSHVGRSSDMSLNFPSFLLSFMECLIFSFRPFKFMTLVMLVALKYPNVQNNSMIIHCFLRFLS